MITTFGTTEQAVVCLSHFLKTKFKQFSDKDLLVNLVRNKDDMRSFGSMQNSQTDGKPVINFPFLRLAYATYALDTSRGGGRKHTFLKLGKDDSGKTVMLSFMPIKLGFGAKFQSDNIKDVLKFSHMLATHYPAVAYELEYETGFKSTVRINFENQFNIAEANLNAPGDSFDWETTFILDILEGNLSQMPSIKEVRIKTFSASGYGKSISESQIDLLDTLNMKFPDIYKPDNVPYVGAYNAENAKL